MSIDFLPIAQPMVRLIEELHKLPGIGPKSAQRLAYFLLRAPEEQAKALAEAPPQDKSEDERPADVTSALTALATDLEDADGPPTAAQREVYADCVKKLKEATTPKDTARKGEKPRRHRDKIVCLEALW